jgi:hypothetical protein
MDPMAKGAPANDVGAAAETLRDGVRATGVRATGVRATGSEPGVKVDVVKVLDRIAAALAALDDARAPKQTRPITKQDRTVQERPRLRHNWG